MICMAWAAFLAVFGIPIAFAALGVLLAASVYLRLILGLISARKG